MDSQQPFQKRSWVLFMIIVLGLGYGWILPWAVHGGPPVSGPSGQAFPAHIRQALPPDGALTSPSEHICVSFRFQEGNGMGNRPTELVRMYFDGIDVTSKLTGIIALLKPPPSGSLCYVPRNPLSSTWHTAKVVYRDIQGERFEYLWRFQVE